MKIRTQRLGNKILPSALILLLAGCVTTQQPAELSSQDNDMVVAATAEAVEDFSSVTAAREKAIDQTGELVLLEESLAAAIDEPNPTDTADNLTESDSEIIAADEVETSTITASEPQAPADIWQRVRSGFQLQDMDHPRVKSDLNWYAKHQSYLDRTFVRADPYFYHIVEQIEARGMPMELALLPVVESAFQPFAYSHGRAAGIWQFIPGTARRFGLKIDWWYDGRRDIKASTTAALNYLEALNKRFDGDWLLALAAYNSGEGTVSKAIRKNKKRGKGTTFWDLKLPRETEGYVPKLLAIASLVANPEQHSVSLKTIDNAPQLAEVNIGSQLDLAIAADMADMSLEQLYTLNPGYNRWATSPDGPHRLLLPVAKAENFKEQLAQLPKQQRVKWVRHRIKNGQTLGQIAQNYKTTVRTIKTANKIRGNNIRAGNYLIIPAASQALNSYALSEGQRLQSKQNINRSGTKIHYTVNGGDTLWDIAMAHKVSVRTLASWNGMAPRDTLRPGQKLVIWSKTKNARSSAPAGNPMAKAMTQKINYRVRNGDSLARISQRFNVSVSKLKKWNPRNTKGKYIQPGQRLVVYVDVSKVAENI